jgi:copper chaperone CopZ
MNDQCRVEPLTKTADPDELVTQQTSIFAVWGMGCPNSAIRVRNSLLSIRGVTDAYVDHLAGMAQVTFDPALVSTDALIDAVMNAAGETHHEYVAQLIA